MHIVVPHVGKSHLTYRLLNSIQDEHHIVLVDGSYVADCDTWAMTNANRCTYVRPGPAERPTSLARNWNIGAGYIPDTESVWMHVATDVEFQPMSWRKIAEELANYPDAGIIKDGPTNWNCWTIRRWAWDLLKPHDEAYKPCGGEDDDLVMKCHAAGIKIRSGWWHLHHVEGGHATRLDIRRDLAGTSWSPLLDHHRIFQKKWGCRPTSRDPHYQAARSAVMLEEKRTAPPDEFTLPPLERVVVPQQVPPTWPYPLTLHLGCGKRRIDGALNVDANPAVEPDYLLDVIADPWPWEDGSVERIEAYHLLEHVGEAAGKTFLARCWRALKPDGILVLEFPDLEALCEKYPRSTQRVRRSLYGLQTNGWQGHRWGYCQRTITQAAKVAGFSAIKITTGTDYHIANEPCLRAEAVK